MNDNKLLLTHYQGRLLSLLINHNRLLSVKVYEEGSSLVGNIYVGRVQSIAKGIDAAFVEIADKKVCFLPLAGCGFLRTGDLLPVQVVRDAVKTKQPVVTAQISLAGNFLAVSEGNDKLGISAKIPAAKKQEIIAFLQEKGVVDENRKWISSFKPVIGAVVRTNAQELKDFEPVLQEWRALEAALRNILETAPYRAAFTCLRKSTNPCLEDLKSYYTWEYDEIVTDSQALYEELQDYVAEQKEICGLELPPVRYYQDEYPLEKLYSIKTHIEEALSSRVWLKSGGYLVIEPTEALTVIDVNTGKCEASKQKSSEDTFFDINMEAAEEIALQLRLRNISGIIIVDFINMDSAEKQKLLLERLKKLTAKDFVRTTVVDITPLGLVEITRKRVNRPLREVWGKEMSLHEAVKLK